MTRHTSHPDILKRLKRAEGHLRRVIEMIESELPCLEIAQQMHAVANALVNAKTTFIHDHIEHCLEHALEQRRTLTSKDLQEFKQISKYL